MGQPQGGEGQLIGGDIGFPLQPLQDLAHQGHFLLTVFGHRFADQIAQALLQVVEALLIDLRIARHIHRFDAAAHSALEAVEQAALPVGEEEDRVALASGAAGAADAVHVGLAIKRRVVVDHQANAIDVESAGGHVGGHEHVDASLLEALDGALTKRLGHITVQHRAGDAFGLQGFSHRHGDGLGAGKDDHPARAVGFKYPQESPQLLLVGQQDVALTNPAGIRFLGANDDLGRVLQVLLTDPLDFRRHRCREQHHLTLAGELFQHPLHVVDEAHPQHLVGFIEHQRLELGDVEGALAHVVHHTAGCAHHHVHTAAQLVDLIAEIGTAIERQHMQPGGAGGIALEGLAHLNGQLAGGSQHQHLRVPCFEVDARQQRQGKGGCFAGAGLGLTQQVAAEHQLRDGCRLNRRGLLVAALLQGFEQGVGQTETSKAAGGFVRHDKLVCLGHRKRRKRRGLA